MSQRGPSSPLPSPRAHLAASLRLFDALAGVAGGAARFPGAELWRAALARPRALPAVAAGMNGLKYDGYVTRGPDGAAWGFACNDRWEGRALWGVARRFAAELGGDYAFGAAEALRDAIGGKPGLTVSVGFDAPGQPPRLKLYVQESEWGQGVTSVAALRAMGRELLGAEVPGGLDGALRPGVVTVGLRADGGRSLKLYLGGADAAALARDVGRAVPERSEELAALAAGMSESSPSAPSFHYVTLRLGEGAPRVALNKIYEHERLGFGADRGALDGAWSEVAALFARAGQSWDDVAAVRRAMSGAVLVPTATALERGCGSADVYMAAWPAGR